MPDYLYKYRSTKTLFEHSELENQEIYFPSLEQLNDPLEGYKNLFWKGDEILWTNLLKHYLLCLMETVEYYLVAGPQFKLDTSKFFVFKTFKTLETQAQRDLYQQISQKFFSNNDAKQLPVLFSELKSPIRRDGLTVCLQSLHTHAVDCVLDIMAENKLIPDNPYQNMHLDPIPCREILDAMYNMEMEQPDRPETTETILAQFAFRSKQIALEPEFNNLGTRNQCAWQYIINEFPIKYVVQIEQLLYHDWFTTCFSDNPTQSAMWGTYGNEHKGVCLKFKTETNKDGKPIIRLNEINDSSSGQNEVRKNKGLLLEFYKVEYTNKFIEIDFFRSLGRLVKRDVDYWWKDSAGNYSPYVNDIIVNLDSKPNPWRESYWKNYHVSMTTKLEDWKHEGEYRLTLSSWLDDHSKTESRKLHYNFHDLQGLIFGIKTTIEDKIRIKKIIDEKCRKEGRTDFEFYQAEYSALTGKIEAVRI